MLPALLQHFADLPDPRVNRTRLHRLSDILGIALCAVICGADSWVQMQQYGLAKREWLSQWLSLDNGIPSHDTFARVFAVLDPRLFGSCLQALTQQLATQVEKHLAIDGKYLRHSFDTSAGKGALRDAQRLGQCAASGAGLRACGPPRVTRSKPFPNCWRSWTCWAVPSPLDAMGCQKNIAAQIVAQGGEYVLALKGNHETIHTDVRLFFEVAEEHRWEDTPHTVFTQDDCGHARHETRRCTTVNLSDLEGRWADEQKVWKGLASLVRIESTRVINGKTTQETRYYLSTLTGGAEQALTARALSLGRGEQSALRLRCGVP